MDNKILKDVIVNMARKMDRLESEVEFLNNVVDEMDEELNGSSIEAPEETLEEEVPEVCLEFVTSFNELLREYNARLCVDEGELSVEIIDDYAKQVYEYDLELF